MANEKILGKRQVKQIGSGFVPASYINNSFIIVVRGTRGQGKTLWTAINMYMYHQRGMKIFHNGFLNFGEQLDINQLFNYAEKNELENCIIALDEAQTYFDSWQSGSNALGKLIHYVTMIRHKNISIYMTTQQLETLSSRLRWQIDYVISPKSYLSFYSTGAKTGMLKSHRLVANYIATDNTPTGFKKSHLKTINNAQQFYNVYSTTNMIDDSAVLDSYTKDKVRENVEMNRELQIGYWLKDRIIPKLGGQKVSAAQITNQWVSDTGDIIESKHMMKVLKNTFGLSTKRSGNAFGVIMPKKAEDLKLTLLED
tara:strand:- start:1455 stop:2390 length:936 start_codon:yes stop_codon:yes gene_type:complete